MRWLFVALLAFLVSCSADPEIEQGTTPPATTTPAPVAPTASEVPTEVPAVDPAAESPTALPEPAAATPTPVPTPTPFPTPEPTPAPLPTPEPTVPVVSDEVPSTQELLDIGLTETQAECFITTIDPNGTGRIEDADLFLEALGTCT